MKKLEKYSSYKDSGVEWIGEIPEHWEVKKLKYISKIKTGYTPDIAKNTNYDINGTVWVKPDNLDEFNPVIDSKEKVSLIGLKKQNLIPKNSILVNCIGTIGKFGIAGVDLITNQQINSIIFNKYVDNAFGKYLVFVSKDEHNKHANGNVVQILNSSSQSNIQFAIPPKEEQTKIASYLDKKIAKIDTAISGKEKLIELLKEQKKIIINDAVTKGLNKNAEFKDSGIEWIGQIPKHWGITKLKYIGASIIGLTYNPSNLCSKDEGVLVLRSSNIQNGKLTLDDNVYIKGYIPKKLFIKENDIVICSRNGSRELIGKCAIAKKEDEKYSFGAFVTVFRSKLNFYVFQILNSEIFKKQSGKFLTSTINQLTVNNFNAFEIPLPPKSEQEKIVEYIENKTTKIDNVVKLQENYIEKLKEYKTTLIDSVVTGKVKV